MGHLDGLITYMRPASLPPKPQPQPISSSSVEVENDAAVKSVHRFDVAAHEDQNHDDAEELASQWLFSDDELLATPSIVDGMPVEKERELRLKGVNFIMQVGIALKLPQLTLSTAAVFFHRFLMRRSLLAKRDLKPLHQYEIAATSLFLATKVEETCRKMKEIVIACCRVAQKKPDLVVDDQTKDFWRWRDTIMLNEDVLLETICFDVTVLAPHRLLFDMLKRLGAEHDKPLRAAAWSFVNDSTSTQLCLVSRPRAIAAAALYCAASHCEIKIGDHPHTGEPWWRCQRVTLSEVHRACAYMADAYGVRTVASAAAAAAARAAAAAEAALAAETATSTPTSSSPAPSTTNTTPIATTPVDTTPTAATPTATTPVATTPTAATPPESVDAGSNTPAAAGANASASSNGRPHTNDEHVGGNHRQHQPAHSRPHASAAGSGSGSGSDHAASPASVSSSVFSRSATAASPPRAITTTITTATVTATAARVTVTTPGATTTTTVEMDTAAVVCQSQSQSQSPPPPPVTTPTPTRTLSTTPSAKRPLAAAADDAGTDEVDADVDDDVRSPTGARKRLRTAEEDEEGEIPAGIPEDGRCADADREGREGSEEGELEE